MHMVLKMYKSDEVSKWILGWIGLTGKHFIIIERQQSRTLRDPLECLGADF